MNIRKKFCSAAAVLTVIVLAAWVAAAAGGGAAENVPELLTIEQPAWGSINRAADGSGKITVLVREWPQLRGELSMPTPFPEIVAANLLSGSSKTPVGWIFNLNATRLFLKLPAEAPAAMPATIELETATQTTQFPDGRIVLSATNAVISGSRAKLESHPGNNRIGFWVDAADTVSWAYKPTRWGMYDVEMVFSAQDGAGTEMKVEIAGSTLAAKRPDTGSWYQYQILPVGRFYLAKAQPFTVKVSCPEKKGIAVANLKALILRPAPEGPSIKQGAGPIVLPAGGAITHSVMMRYEPATNKNCLGFWVNAQDWAEWEFEAVTPGTYEVEVTHGAGKNQGGDILVTLNGTELPFTTVDTGDIHKHTPLKIGKVTLEKAGKYSLSLKPQKKFGGAIMDLTEIRLVPAAK